MHLRVFVNRDGHDLCSRVGAVAWRTTVSSADLAAAFHDLCTWDELRWSRPLHLDTRRRLGSVLLGDPEVPGTPASVLVDAAADGSVAARLEYQVDEDAEAWQVPFETALLPWVEEPASLVSAGIVLVQDIPDADPAAEIRLPARPTVVLLATSVPETSSLYVPGDEVQMTVAESLRHLAQTEEGYGFRSLTAYLRNPDMPDHIPAVHLLAHGEPGHVRLLRSPTTLSTDDVTAVRLGDWAARHRVALAVLTVCHSAEGLGQELRRAGVGVVVAARGDLMSDVATEIASQLWGQMAGGADVDEAVLALRRALEARDRDLPADRSWASANLVVLHDERRAVPFAESHRTGEEERSARRRSIDGEVLDGLTWRFDAACSLDRRPGTIVVADGVSGDLLVALRAGEALVADAARKHGIAASARTWDSHPGDREPPGGDHPWLVTVKAGTTAANVVEMWKDRIGTERLVFRVVGAAGEGEGVMERARALALALRARDRAVLLVERSRRDLETAAPGPAVEVLGARLEAGEITEADVTNLPLDQLSALARHAAMHLAGPARAVAERGTCTHVVGAEQWLAGCIQQGLPWPDPVQGTWGPRSRSARRALTVACIRLGRSLAELPWNGAPADPDLAEIMELAERTGTIPFDAFLASAPLSELALSTERIGDWDDLRERDVPKAGFGAVAAALRPSVSAVRLLTTTETWGWSPA